MEYRMCHRNLKSIHGRQSTANCSISFDFKSAIPLIRIQPRTQADRMFRYRKKQKKHTTLSSINNKYDSKFKRKVCFVIVSIFV